MKILNRAITMKRLLPSELSTVRGLAAQSIRGWRQLRCGFLLLLALAAASDEVRAMEYAAPQTLDHTFTISDRDVVIEAMGDYSQVTIRGEDLDSDPSRAGQPRLPIILKWFILPDHCKISAFTATSSDPTTLSGSHRPAPIQGDRDEPTPEDSRYYRQDTPYPGYTAIKLKEYYHRGYHLAQVLIYPIQWLPVERALVLDRGFRLHFDLERLSATEEDAIVRIERPESRNLEYPEIASWVRSRVANPGDFELFYPRPAIAEREDGREQRLVSSDPYGAQPSEWPSSFGPYAKMVIITNNHTQGGESVGALAQYCQDYYANWQTARGRFAVVRTVDQITGEYTAYDAAASIKAFVSHAMQAWGTEYILLVGDTEIVPTRRLGGPGHTFNERLDAATDSYYTIFNGNWNVDIDAYEWEGNADVSFTNAIPQVFIGRLPCHGLSDLSVVLSKLRRYQEQGNPAPASFYTSALLATGPTNDFDPEAGGSGYYATEAIASELEPRQWTMTRLYADPGNATFNCATTPTRCANRIYDFLHGPTSKPYTAWTGNALSAQLNSGHHIVYHGEHSFRDKLGGPSWTNDGLDATIGVECATQEWRDDCQGYLSNLWKSVEALTRDRAVALTNAASTDGYSIVISGGSWTNEYDLHAVSEALLRAPSGGAVAYIGKTWSFGGLSTVDYVPMINKMLTAGTREIGKAFVAGIDERGLSGTGEAILFLKYNLLGDPGMAVWSGPPGAPTVSGPTSISSLGPQTLSFTITDSASGQPIPDATVCIAQGEVAYAVRRTDAAGVAAFKGFPVHDASQIAVSVVAADHLPYASAVTVVTPSGYLTYDHHTFNDAAPRGDGDGVLETGEAAWLRVVLKNTGSTAVTSPTIALRTTPNAVFRLAINGQNRPADIYIGKNAAHPPAAADSFRLPLSWEGLRVEAEPTYTSVKETFKVFREDATGKYVIVSRSPSASADSVHSGSVTASGGISSVTLTGESGTDTYGVVGDSLWFSFRGDASEDRLSFRAESSNWITTSNGAAPVRPSVAAGDTIGRSFEISTDAGFDNGYEAVFTTSAQYSLNKYAHSDFKIVVHEPVLDVLKLADTLRTGCSGGGKKLVLRPVVWNRGDAEADSVTVTLEKTGGSGTVLDATARVGRVDAGAVSSFADSIVLCAQSDADLYGTTYTLSVRKHLHRSRYEDIGDLIGGGGPPGPISPPNTPLVEPVGRALQLTWNPVSYSAPITHYNVYYYYPVDGQLYWTAKASGASRAVIDRILGAPIQPMDYAGDLREYSFRVEACSYDRCSPLSSLTGGASVWYPEYTGWPKSVRDGVITTAPKVATLNGRQAVFVAGRQIYGWWLDNGTPVKANSAEGELFAIPNVSNEPLTEFTEALGVVQWTDNGTVRSAIVGNVRKMGVYAIELIRDADQVHYHGSVLWRKWVYCDYAAPVVANLDPVGVNLPVVICPGRRDTLYAWTVDGSPYITNLPSGSPNGAYASAYESAKFPNNNNMNSVAILPGQSGSALARIVQSIGRTGRVMCWNTVARNNGALATPLWNTVVEDTTGHGAASLSSPAVGDVDGDGQYDIVVTNQTYGGVPGRVHILNRSGAVTHSYADVSGAIQFGDRTSDRPAPRPALACLGLSGGRACVITSSTRPNQSSNPGKHSVRVFALEASSPYALTPVQCEATQPMPSRSDATGTASRLWREPIVADLTGDGSAEILAPSVFGTVFGWSYNGTGDIATDGCTPTLGWPIQLGDVGHVPLVYDGGIVIASEDGSVHHYQVPAESTTQLWSQYASDSGNRAVQVNLGCGGARQSDGSSGGLVLRPGVCATEQQVEFAVRETQRVVVGIYDASGRLVRRLADGVLRSGLQSLRWDARDNSGRRVPSGVYFYRIRGAGTEQTASTVVVR